MMQEKLPVIIIGGGGHAKVVADVLTLSGNQIIGFTDIIETKESLFPGLLYLGDDDTINKYLPEKILLANGLGSTKNTFARRAIYEHFSGRGFRFTTCVHPSAIIARNVIINEGAQIMAGVVIQAGSEIGNDVIINTRASVDHDCVIGAHAHIAPGATLSGGVTIGVGAHIGTGAIIIQNRSIGQEACVAAGAVVIKDVDAFACVCGIPAESLNNRQGTIPKGGVC